MDANLQIVIVAAMTLLSPALLALLLRYQNRKDKAQEYEREDAKQDKTDKALALTASLVADATARQIADRHATSLQLGEIEATGKVIHVLVNSNLTTSKKAELAGIEAQLVLLKKFTPEDTDAIKVIQNRLTELQIEIADRLKQQELVDKSVAGRKVEAASTGQKLVEAGVALVEAGKAPRQVDTKAK